MLNFEAVNSKISSTVLVYVMVQEEDTQMKMAKVKATTKMMKVCLVKKPRRKLGSKQSIETARERSGSIGERK